MAAGVLGLAFAPDVRDTPRRSIAATPPTLARLNQSIAAAEGFIAALYRPIGDGRAVTSEYFALPIRIYLPLSRRWILAGESRTTSSVSATRSTYAAEQFEIVFENVSTVAVQVEWRKPVGSYTIRLRELTRATEPFILYLDHRRIGRSGRHNRVWTISLPNTDRAPLRAFRYTVRHGAQLAQNFYRYRGDRVRFAATKELIASGGFHLNSDLTAPIWGRGVQFEDDFPFDPTDAYHDCGATLPSSATAYPYRSKVCSISRGLYIWLTHSDPLAPAITALHVTERDQDPDRKIHAPRLPIALPMGADLRAAEPRDRSVRQTAAWIESIYRETGYGVPRCLPAHCENTWVSGVRTSEFGALEAMLGYRYGDKISRSYADAVAGLTLKTQIGHDGIVRTSKGTFYRPAARGSFMFGWNAQLRAYLDEPLTSKLTHDLSMAAEYTGIVASNSETTISAYAFLVAYRCVRYGVGCQGLGAWARR